MPNAPSSGVKKVTTKTSSNNSNHPTYGEMICAAITNVKGRTGTSRQAIAKYIKANYMVGDDTKYINKHIKTSLRKITIEGKIKQFKGTGASGSFKMGDNAKTSEKKVKTTAAKSSSTKRIKKPKLPGTPKKPVAKTAVKSAMIVTPMKTGIDSTKKKMTNTAVTKKITTKATKPVQVKKIVMKGHATKKTLKINK
ncbi:unnamed protein product [Gordionus sp. m RMFG-2023]